MRIKAKGIRITIKCEEVPAINIDPVDMDGVVEDIKRNVITIGWTPHYRIRRDIKE